MIHVRYDKKGATISAVTASVVVYPMMDKRSFSEALKLRKGSLLASSG